MSNMLPQNQSFNAGDWETVEIYERRLAQNQTIHIVAGGLGSIGTTSGGVNEPKYMWKAIYADGKWTCWMMKNMKSSVRHSYKYWIISTDLFDNLTGLNLK